MRSDEVDDGRRPPVLVTGVTGQDGWYLAEQLLRDGEEVHGVVREERQAAPLRDQLPGLVLHVGDLTDDASLRRTVEAAAPGRIYNLAGSTSVARSWSEPVLTADVIGVGAVRLLKAAWDLQERSGDEVRFLQASSAEVFGDPAEVPQDERTAHEPVTPYGAAKDFAHLMVEVYRRRGMFATAAILYNHESPRRPDTFVARKITRAVARIARGLQESVSLGNIDALRDWGYAPDHVRAMATILSADVAGDYVVATGEARSVRDFVREAFAVVGIDDYDRHVRIDPALYRPADPRALVGDPARLRALGWAPSVSFEQLVRTMVEADVAELERSDPAPTRAQDGLPTRGSTS